MKRMWLLSLCCLLLTGCGKAYWVEDCGDYRVALRDSPDTPELLEVVVLRGEEETVVETLDTPPERVSVRAFSDVLGYSGFRLTERQGLALELTHMAEDWLREREIPTMQLQVLQNNPAAHRYWQRAGMGPVGTLYDKKLVK